MQALEQQVDRLDQLLAAKTAKGCNDDLARIGESKRFTAKAAVPDQVNALYASIFEQTEKLPFGQLDWGDAEAKVLSQALYEAKGLKSLSLEGNRIQDEGAKILAASLKQGAAPKLKKLNLASNPGLSAEAKQALRDAREGLTVL